MTNEEAVEIIKECKEKGFKHTFYTLNEYHTALDMAIQALEQEPCEDAISRHAAKRIIYDEFEGWPTEEEIVQMKRLIKNLDELPLVSVAEKTALLEQVRWERDVAISQLHELGYEFGEKIEQQPCIDAISRQAAIADIYDHFMSIDGGVHSESVNKCMEIIRKLPSVSTEKTDAYKQGWHDAIGKALNEAYDVVIDGERFSVVQEETLLGLGMSSELPSVSKEKTGRWEEVQFKTIPCNKISKAKKCSVCGKRKDKYVTWDYCPNCGSYNGGGNKAKMEVEE